MYRGIRYLPPRGESVALLKRVTIVTLDDGRLATEPRRVLGRRAHGVERVDLGDVVDGRGVVRVRERAARARSGPRGRRLAERRDVDAGLVVGRRRRLRRLGNITVVGLGVVPGVVAV